MIVTHRYLTIAALLSSLSSIQSFSQSAALIEQNVISIEGDTLLLSEIVQSKSLVFRYSILNCRSCIDSILFSIKRNEYRVGEENIILLTYYNKLRHFIISARLNQISYRIFLIPNNKLFLEDDNFKFPYIFIIDNNLKIINPLIIYDIAKQKDEIDTYITRYWQ